MVLRSGSRHSAERFRLGDKAPLARSWFPLLLLLFVGSGCAALIYEIVWFQLLQMVIGSTAVSLAILLGTFMGGMCIGSLALARVMPPTQHPLRAYAMLEAGIGVFGLLLVFGMPVMARLYAHIGGEGLGGLLVRRRNVHAAVQLAGYGDR